MNILAIESSCDETAAAVIRDGTEIISNVVASSSAMHQKWGGIVPEVASREQLKAMIPVLSEALAPFIGHPDPPAGGEGSHPNKRRLDSGSGAGMTNVQQVISKHIDAIAVTVGPGLIGSLLIGVESAKTIAYICNKPLIPVNHVLAHMYGNFVISSQPSALSHQTIRLKAEGRKLIAFPAISLVVSGGHTELYLMESIKDLKWLGGTIDDAAGEAFDKTARLLGFGSGGGLSIQKAAALYRHPGSTKCYPGSQPRKKRLDSCLRRNDNNKPISFPRPMMHDKTLNFSFSGLKTAVLREVDKHRARQQNPVIPGIETSLIPGMTGKQIQQLSFEVQEAIADVLVFKTMKAVEMCNAKSILISGGVASNERLRSTFITTINDKRLTTNFLCPPVEFCTDNAAMIGSYAFFRGKPVDWHEVSAVPDLSVEV